MKLCGQIAVSMMRCSLESCMFFAGTDCGLKKTARPFLSDLEKELEEAVKLVG